MKTPKRLDVPNPKPPSQTTDRLFYFDNVHSMAQGAK